MIRLLASIAAAASALGVAAGHPGPAGQDLALVSLITAALVALSAAIHSGRWL